MTTAATLNGHAILTPDGVEIFYKDWGPRDARPIVFHRQGRTVTMEADPSESPPHAEELPDPGRKPVRVADAWVQLIDDSGVDCTGPNFGNEAAPARDGARDAHQE